MKIPQYNSFEFQVEDTQAGERLDKALTAHPAILSRSQATSLIDRGFVTLAGEIVKPAYRIQGHEKFHVRIPIEKKVTDLEPYNISLDIVHEDDDLLVVNKPAGLVVHPAYGHTSDTLVNALIHHSRSLASSAAPERPGIVHRLDKETTGLLVVAKTAAALTGLAKQFKRKTVHRVYWAISYGHLKEPEGTITSYIRRHPTDRKRFASEKLQSMQEPQGKLAITHFKVKKNLNCGLSFLHLQLETGRTHQIRVHLSEKHHAIVGDPIYGSLHRIKSLPSLELRKALTESNRLFLHAAELGFVHPTSGETHRFSCDWPQDIQPILQIMGLNT